MNKMIYGGAFLASVTLAIGAVWFPNQPFMWLASTSLNFIILRCVLAIMALALLMSHPPRSIIFRTVLSVTGAVLLSWALRETYNNAMKLMDGTMLTSIAISFLLAAAELRNAHSRHISVKST
jgi:hypothetical protein